MKFTDTPICKQRTQCYNCRNNNGFRQQMENQYGPWECPENIPLGANLDQLPQVAQDAHQKMIEMQEARAKQLEEVKTAIDELEMIVGKNGLEKLEIIRIFLFPNSKTAVRCVQGGKEIGDVDEECCGGKIKKVKAYQCKTHIIATDKKCSRCTDYKVTEVSAIPER
jgi:hypothetical protein